MSYSTSTARAASPDAYDQSQNRDPAAYPRNQDDAHTRCVRWFEESERASLNERLSAELARDYVSCIQWTKPEEDALRARNQPIVTINYCSRKVQLLCGLERKARTDPKAFPRTPAEEDRADAATQTLRFIADDCDFPLIRSAVYNDMLVEGLGGAIIDLEDDGQGGANIVPQQVPWDRIWRDPHSRMPDFADARYKGIVIWLDRDQVDELYPNAQDVCADSFAVIAGTYDDRPGNVAWQDTTRQRCRVVQCHWTEGGEWWEATYTRAGFLVPPAVSPLKDRKGKSACRLLLQSAYIDRENRRYGMIRDLISPQDEINKRRSKALHLLSTHQVITEAGAVGDEDKARREVAKPDGFIVVNPGMRFDIENGADMAVGQMKLLEHATAEMQASGPNASMSGTDPRELSGRAILAQQAGGAAQNEPLADSLRHWSRRVYEMCWMAARQYWTAGKWVRVTDDLGATRWVGINRPVTLRDELAALPDPQRAMAMQQLQIVPNDPRLDQVIRVENDITDLDVDITIEEGMDVPAIQAEQFQTLVQLASIQPGLIPGDVLIAASSLKNKDQLLERMKAHAAAQAQQQQEMAPLIKAGAVAEVQGKQAKAEADHALALERRHNVVRSIADVHDMHRNAMMPDMAEPGVDPALQNAQAAANVQKTAAEVATEQARARDLHFAGVKKVAETHAIMHPPPQRPAS